MPLRLLLLLLRTVLLVVAAAVEGSKAAAGVLEAAFAMGPVSARRLLQPANS